MSKKIGTPVVAEIVLRSCGGSGVSSVEGAMISAET